eukprot:14574212-Heterocapsa_arctica.AAC.1
MCMNMRAPSGAARCGSGDPEPLTLRFPWTSSLGRRLGAWAWRTTGHPRDETMQPWGWLSAGEPRPWCRRVPQRTPERPLAAARI